MEWELTLPRYQNLRILVSITVKTASSIGHILSTRLRTININIDSGVTGRYAQELLQPQKQNRGKRGRRVAGGELRHLAGSPGGGGGY